MTSKADLTPEQWKLVLEGPPSAGMIVITAQRGGTLRETVSISAWVISRARLIQRDVHCISRIDLARLIMRASISGNRFGRPR